LTPATLIGVSGRPTRAAAVSIANDGVLACDQLSESGAAQQSAVAAIIPSALDLFIIATPSPPALPVLKIEMTFSAASLMQIKRGHASKRRAQLWNAPHSVAQTSHWRIMDWLRMAIEGTRCHESS
jgi:hypothetical protein